MPELDSWHSFAKFLIFLNELCFLMFMDDYYDRQVTFLGSEAIEQLRQSTVVVVGCGGLGTAVVQILARMGVGTLVLFDGDVVQTHNLSRQQLFTTADVGKQKVVACQEHLARINPAVTVKVESQEATLETLAPYAQAQLVLDCTDRLASRRLIDSFCSSHRIPWVHGAAIEDKGTVCLFDSRAHPEITFDTVYGDASKDVKCVDCGVLATTTSTIGALQSHIAINLLIDKPVRVGLYRLRLDAMEFEHIRL